MQRLIIYGLYIFIAAGCGSSAEERKAPDAAKGTYAYDAAFLKQHTAKVLELAAADGSARVLLAADYQGRVMTSTAAGDTGLSYGWLNYELIASGEKKKGFNPVGGEERFWLGPEGGQYAIYFKPKDSFSFNNWQVPAIIDTVAYDVVRATEQEVVFAKNASIINYSGTRFDIGIERTIRLLNRPALEKALRTALPSTVKFVGYQTENTLTNRGAQDWTKEKGLLSIWLLGMFTPTPQTMVIIPFSPVSDAASMITSDYFGPVPPERLRISDSVLYFTCDGKYRSKIGLSPLVAKSIAASFDFQHNVLTIVVPEIHKNAPYVNAKWELQKEPYKGDVINAYNDGPLADGTQMGPFYEIESSSPALALKKGNRATYRQTTVHLQGDYNALRQMAQNLLGVDLNKIKP